jgi:hypothetical protein
MRQLVFRAAGGSRNPPRRAPHRRTAMIADLRDSRHVAMLAPRRPAIAKSTDGRSRIDAPAMPGACLRAPGSL